MTLTEFLLKLHETPGTWERVTGRQRIRLAGWPEVWECPLSFVFGHDDYDHRAEEVGLPADEIMEAADGYPLTSARRRLRQMLLWATGLA